MDVAEWLLTWSESGSSELFTWQQFHKHGSDYGAFDKVAGHVAVWITPNEDGLHLDRFADTDKKKSWEWYYAEALEEDLPRWHPEAPDPEHRRDVDDGTSEVYDGVWPPKLGAFLAKLMELFEKYQDTFAARTDQLQLMKNLGDIRTYRTRFSTPAWNAVLQLALATFPELPNKYVAGLTVKEVPALALKAPSKLTNDIMTFLEGSSLMDVPGLLSGLPDLKSLLEPIVLQWEEAQLRAWMLNPTKKRGLGMNKAKAIVQERISGFDRWKKLKANSAGTGEGGEEETEVEEKDKYAQNDEGGRKKSSTAKGRQSKDTIPDTSAKSGKQKSKSPNAQSNPDTSKPRQKTPLTKPSTNQISEKPEEVTITQSSTNQSLEEPADIATELEKPDSEEEVKHKDAEKKAAETDQTPESNDEEPVTSKRRRSKVVNDTHSKEEVDPVGLVGKDDKGRDFMNIESDAEDESRFTSDKRRRGQLGDATTTSPGPDTMDIDNDLPKSTPVEVTIRRSQTGESSQQASESSQLTSKSSQQASGSSSQGKKRANEADQEMTNLLGDPPVKRAKHKAAKRMSHPGTRAVILTYNFYTARTWTTSYA